MKGFRQKVQFKGSPQFNCLVGVREAAKVIISAETHSLSLQLLCALTGTTAVLILAGLFNQARRVPLYGWSPSRPRALCNTEKEAATGRGAPSGWPQKGSTASADSRPPNFTIRLPEATMAAHQTADLTRTSAGSFLYVFYLLCEIKGCSLSNLETVEQ